MQTDNVLDAVNSIYQETGIAINCVTCGYDVFVRYWPVGECEQVMILSSTQSGNTGERTS